MKIPGVFKCTRCGAELTDLRMLRDEGTVCINEEACKIMQGLEGKDKGVLHLGRQVQEDLHHSPLVGRQHRVAQERGPGPGVHALGSLTTV